MFVKSSGISVVGLSTCASWAFGDRLGARVGVRD